MKTRNIILTISAGISLAFTAWAGTIDELDRKPPPMECTIWQGIDEISGPASHFRAELLLKVMGDRGRLTIDAWNCPSGQVTKPEDCSGSYLHTRVYLAGPVENRQGHLKFTGTEVIDHEVVKGPEILEELYCNDNLEGPVNGDIFMATHTDGCSPETKIEMKRRNCA
tara:strand:- start:1094 stop:1597 length:504 start_codon:yes stop_codon:yes gene_type:complete